MLVCAMLPPQDDAQKIRQRHNFTHVLCDDHDNRAQDLMY